MVLADDIRGLQDRVLRDLGDAHDYFVDTRFAWRTVRSAIKAGRKFVIRNKATGTLTTPSDLAGKVRRYVAEHVVEATFQQFVSIFENFFFELLAPLAHGIPAEPDREESGRQGNPGLRRTRTHSCLWWSKGN